MSPAPAPTAGGVALAEALEGSEVLEWRGDRRVPVVDVHHDSRRVTPGSLFCAVIGHHHDGHDHVPSAVARGAAAVLAERAVDAAPASLAVVASVRRAMGPAASRVAGDPSRRLAVAAVTGTNGKTTTTHLVQAVLAHAGVGTGLIGTLGGARTTPEAPDLQRLLARFVADGRRACAMEVSSHALDQWRVDGTWFTVAAFTNLSRDHLDHHGTMEAYFRAKARLFTPDLCGHAVVNLDDPHGRLLADAATVPTTGFRLTDADGLEVGRDASTFRWRGHAVRLGLGGSFNVANALAAAEVVRHLGLGIDDATIAEGLGSPLVVPGRFERVAGAGREAVVDFAHTPDALEKVLAAASEVAERVLVVFGCGGDRDPSKRGPMGAAAVRGADVVVLTADNSRGEATDDILAAVRAGADAETQRRATEVVVEPDRRLAIRAALVAAGPRDLVVVAGKGHETTLTIGDRVEAFDDREVVRDELRRLDEARGGRS